MNSIAEKILQKAIEGGNFDFSSNNRRSLKLEENPFQDPSNRLSFRILKNAGMRHLWLETGIGIRTILEDAYENLLKAAKKWKQEGSVWESAVNQFYD